MKSPLDILDWGTLDEASRDAALRRPAQRDAAGLLEQARRIVADVRARGDTALREYTASLDHVQLETFGVSDAEFAAADAALTPVQRAALERAIETVTRFHELQTLPPLRLETAPGVVCERMTVALESVGLYVPAGTAPLPSTALMLAVPARIAGCPVRVMCTPPRPDGSADPAVLVAARLCGVRKVFKLGGAQAVAAMAYGTASVPKVVKIFGPGNSWVTAAKQVVAQDADGAALDMPAGPSEVLVIADESARPAFVAADLLAQAEHSVDAQVVLVTVSRRVAEACVAEVARQLAALPRREIAGKAIAESRVILVPTVAAAMEVANRYAPEHLILQVTSPRDLLPQVRNAGSVFLGAWTPETMGDYCSGTNHVLPTYGHARAYSGLSVLDFVKRITVQELTADGLRNL
ncbi:MAG: histidinol dehydrogenase, partial [Gammaproteobacteria bacterium]|nr:histidinol dehydrogenase [Gammaproteobacteria bacterium]